MLKTSTMTLMLTILEDPSQSTWVVTTPMTSTSHDVACRKKSSSSWVLLTRYILHHFAVHHWY
jgi:hypothetical protein